VTSPKEPSDKFDIDINVLNIDVSAEKYQIDRTPLRSLPQSDVSQRTFR
jgi:hypothetical protein